MKSIRNFAIQASEPMLLCLIPFFFIIATAVSAEEFRSSAREDDSVPDCLINRSCWDNNWASGNEAAHDSISLGEIETQGTILKSSQMVEQAIRQRRAAVEACEEEFPYNPADPLNSTHLACTFTNEQIGQLQRYRKPEDKVRDHNSSLLKDYLNSEKWLDCEAYTDILEAYGRGKLTMNREALRYAFQKYRASCFVSGDKIDSDIINRLAFIVYFQGERASALICGGVIFSSELVLTARHCFVTRDNIAQLQDNAEEGTRAQPQKIAGMRIITPGYKPYIFDFSVENERLPPEAQAFDIVNPMTDWILLRVKGLANSVDALPVASIDEQRRDFLEVAGIFANIRSINRAIRDGSLPDELRNQIVFEKSPTCNVVSLKNNCLVHACQTMRSFSGSPIFSRSDGVYKLAGLHLGYMSIEDNVCGFRRSSIITNRGISLTRLLSRPDFSSLVGLPLYSNSYFK